MITILEVAWYWFAIVGIVVHVRPALRWLRKRKEISILHLGSEHIQKFYSDKPRVDSIKLRP